MRKGKSLELRGAVLTEIADFPQLEGGSVLGAALIHAVFLSSVGLEGQILKVKDSERGSAFGSPSARVLQAMC